MANKYYLQLESSSGRSKWLDYYRSKRRAIEVANDFREHGWRVKITTYPTKWNKR